MGDVAAMMDVWHIVRPAQEPWEKEYSVVHRGPRHADHDTEDGGLVLDSC